MRELEIQILARGYENLIFGTQAQTGSIVLGELGIFEGF